MDEEWRLVGVRMFSFVTQLDEATEHLRSCIRFRKRGAGQIGFFSYVSVFYIMVSLLNPTFFA